MAWRTMILRNSKVLAQCDDAGALVVDEGRVEIRYKPNDGRAYGAGLRNLLPSTDETVFPDSHCGPAEAPDKSKSKSKSGSKKKKKSSKAAGPPPPTAPTGDEVLFYADGACSGNPGPAGLGVVMIFDDTRRELSEYLGHGTNNIAELTAILRAAEAMETLGRPMHLYTDSTYCIGVLTKGWKAKANKELIAEAKRALGKLDDVKLFYVKGHAGIELNEVADQLAVLAVENRGSTGWVG